MAKLNEQKITIKISELLRDNEQVKEILSDEELARLIAVIQELVGENKIIEVD